MTEEIRTGSKAAYARHRGCKPSWVTELARRGLLIMIDGKVDFEQSDVAISAAADPRGEAVRARHARSRAAGGATVAEQAPSDTYARTALARARCEETKAALLELELAEAEGRVAAVQGIAAAGANVARTVREELDRLLPRLSPTLAAETDPHTVAMMLEGEFRGVMASVHASLSAQIGASAHARS